MTSQSSTWKLAYGWPLALLILAGLGTPVFASTDEADQQSQITEEPQSAATTSSDSRLSATEIAEAQPLTPATDPSRRGVTVRLVQYRMMRPSNGAAPAQAPAQNYTIQPGRIARALSTGSPLAVPMKAAPMFAQPVARAYNGWQPRYGQQAYQSYQQPAVNYGYGGGGDAYGFTSWLNSVRAQYGLRPVTYDPSLAATAAANNAQQAARGLGHYVMGGATRQNAAIGTAESIRSQWMNSPAHRAALLDPNISSIGLSGSGSYWTMNAR